MPDAERLSFFATMAQILATLLVALALLPRFQGTPPIRWITLLLFGAGLLCAIYGATPVWSDLFWRPAFGAALAATSVAVFAIVSSIGPANDRKQEDQMSRELREKAERLDPTPPPP